MPTARIVTAYTEDVEILASQLRARGYTVETMAPGEERSGTADLEITVDRCAAEDGLVRAADAAFPADADIYIAPGLYAPARRPVPEEARGELQDFPLPPNAPAKPEVQRQEPEPILEPVPVEVCESAPPPHSPEIVPHFESAPCILPEPDLQERKQELSPEPAPLQVESEPAPVMEPAWSREAAPALAEESIETREAAVLQIERKNVARTAPAYDLLARAGRALDSVGGAIIAGLVSVLLQVRLLTRKPRRPEGRAKAAKARPVIIARKRRPESPQAVPPEQPRPYQRRPAAPVALAAASAPTGKKRPLTIREREWITAGVFSAALVLAVLLAWAAANRRPASPVPAGVLMRSGSTEQQVPFGPVKLLPPGTPANGSGAVVKPRPAQPSAAAPKRGKSAKAGARDSNQDDGEVIVRHFAPSHPAHTVVQSRNGVKHFSDTE